MLFWVWDMKMPGTVGIEVHIAFCTGQGTTGRIQFLSGKCKTADSGAQLPSLRMAGAPKTVSSKRKL